jgi:hypothetical protein
MSGHPTAVGAQMQLDYITGRSLRYTEPFDVYLALLTSDVPDNVLLSGLPEITTPGYGRQLIPWSAATLSRPSSSGNSAVVTFGPVTADMSNQATFGALVTAQTGTDGDVLWVWQLDTPQQAVNGQALQLALNKLTISQS